MKVAVLGAPGSGKSEFADSLADLMMDQTGEPWGIIDDYVAELQYDTGQEYGAMGDHVDDLQVVFKRRELELQTRKQSFITVGTVLDSAAHNFARAEAVEHSRSLIGMTQVKLQAIAATFGMLYTDTWDYDYAFWLRRPAGRTDGLYLMNVQYTLNALIETYRAPVLSFNTEVPDDQKAATAAKTIREHEELQFASSAERGVRRSSETGEADGDSSESVPDVSEQARAVDDA